MQTEENKEIYLKLIAIGLNSLINRGDDKTIKEFMALPTHEILNVWQLLSPELKFKIFEKYLPDFQKYLEQIK